MREPGVSPSPGKAALHSQSTRLEADSVPPHSGPPSSAQSVQLQLEKAEAAEAADGKALSLMEAAKAKQSRMEAAVGEQMAALQEKAEAA